MNPPCGWWQPSTAFNKKDLGWGFRIQYSGLGIEIPMWCHHIPSILDKPPIGKTHNQHFMDFITTPIATLLLKTSKNKASLRYPVSFKARSSGWSSIVGCGSSALTLRYLRYLGTQRGMDKPTRSMARFRRCSFGEKTREMFQWSQ